MVERELNSKLSSIAGRKSDARDWPLSSMRRQRVVFGWSVGVFIVLCSFIYGLQSGLSRRVPNALASADFAQNTSWQEELDSSSFKKLDLPSGVSILPMGKDVRINGKNAEVVSFFSNRGVRELLTEQVQRWEKKGFYVLGVGTASRGLALAVDIKQGDRYSITAWLVPPGIKQAITQGNSVQGIISATTVEDSVSSEFGEDSGRVPGVPLIPGGEAGAVYSSTDRGVRSYSGVYKNPGSLSDNVAFYRTELIAAGWRDGDDGGLALGRDAQLSHLSFVRGNEETMLLFFPLPKTAQLSEEQTKRTLVQVMLGPKLGVVGR